MAPKALWHLLGSTADGALVKLRFRSSGPGMPTSTEQEARIKSEEPSKRSQCCDRWQDLRICLQRRAVRLKARAASLELSFPIRGTVRGPTCRGPSAGASYVLL